MSIAGGVGAAVRLPTPDARFGVEVQAARSPGRTRFRRGAYASTALTDVATVTRATTAWGVDQGGNVAAVAAGQPVVTTAGLAVYEARTNSIRNPTGLGAVVASPGTSPTNWGINAAANGISRSIAGTGVENGLPYVDIRFSGTATSTFNFYLNLEVGGQVAATNTQSWTLAVYLRRVSSLVPVTAQLGIQMQDSGGAALTGDLLGAAVTVPAILTRQALATTTNKVGTAFVMPYIGFAFTSGATYDETIRIAAPNLKQGADIADAPILQTNNAAATRNADVISETVSIPPGQAFTVQGRAILPPSSVTNACLFDLVDTTSSPQNRLSVSFTGGSQLGLYCNSAGNGVGGAALGSQGVSAGQPVGFCISINGSTVRYSVNGGAPVTYSIAGGAFSAVLTRLFLGCTYAGTLQLNGMIRDLSAAMRDFTDSEMRAASDASLTHDVDFVSQVYSFVGAPYVTPTDLPGTTFTRTGSRFGVDASGALRLYASGALRVNSAGATFGATATNKCSNYNIAPTDLTGLTTYNGGTHTIVPRASLPAPVLAGLNALDPEGKVTAVVKTVATATDQGIDVVGATGNLNAHSVQAYVYVEALAGASVGICINNSNVGLGVAGSTATAAAWTRLTNPNLTPIDTVSRLRVRTIGGGATYYWFGNQMEESTTCSDLIPVAGASATATPDVLASTNDNNPAAYTVVAEFTIPATGHPSGRVWCWDDGTSNNAVFVYFDRTSPRLWLTFCVGGVFTDVNLGVAAVGSTYKVAAGIAAGSVAASVNGAAVVTRATPAVLPAVNTFRVGRSSVGNEWGAGIRRIRRFSVRKTNSELQALAA